MPLAAFPDPASTRTDALRPLRGAAAGPSWTSGALGAVHLRRLVLVLLSLGLLSCGVTVPSWTASARGTPGTTR